MKRRHKQINNYSYYNKKTFDVEPVIEKRYKILAIIICLFMLVLVTSLGYIQIFKNKYYSERLSELVQDIVEGDSAPRGRIYDRNGKLLVDNVGVNTIVYKKQVGVSTNDEIRMAYKLADLIEIDYGNLRDYDLRNFWVKNHKDEANSKIKESEWKRLEERRITNSDIEALKLERVTDEELNQYSNIDREAAYIYYLMNHGYSYSEKVIKKENVSDEEYAKVASNLSDLKGFSTKINWERTYPYGSVFKSILGSVSSSESGLPAELKDYYLAIGYSLTDRVGTSYIERQYEALLKGTKNKYEIMDNGEYKLKEPGTRGNDIMLTIDIELQEAIEDILENEMLSAKYEPYTQYFDATFVVITNPNTGEILAMAGKQIVNDDGEYKIYDYTPGVINASITAGSAVKGASHIVGYNTGALKIGEVRNDACIKVAATPLKCSFHEYGNINDLEALKYSSNTYQFRTAMKVGGAKYQYDAPLVIDDKAFDTYRDIFSEFGLGVKTEIDLPNEVIGYQGKSRESGLLLDFAIGQYDNYTPIQLSQYIGTIANGGYRMKPYLLKGVYAPTKNKLTELIYSTSPEVLNEVDTEEVYLNRVREGFRMVMASGGTGSGYIPYEYKPAGKTGTAQSFVDADGDGRIDTETITANIVAYAPYDNPEVTFTILSPNISTGNVQYSSMSKVNMRISQKVSQKYFEIFE